MPIEITKLSKQERVDNIESDLFAKIGEYDIPMDERFICKYIYISIMKSFVEVVDNGDKNKSDIASLATLADFKFYALFKRLNEDKPIIERADSFLVNNKPVDENKFWLVVKKHLSKYEFTPLENDSGKIATAILEFEGFYTDYNEVNVLHEPIEEGNHLKLTRIEKGGLLISTRFSFNKIELDSNMVNKLYMLVSRFHKFGNDVVNETHTLDIKGDITVEFKNLWNYLYITIAKDDFDFQFYIGSNKWILTTLTDYLSTGKLYEKKLSYPYRILDEPK